MNDSFLTVTGVTATILSLIFAAAAIWNSHVRRKNLEEIHSEKKPAAPARAEKFVMPVDAPPAPSAPQPQAALPSAAVPPKPQPQALFRKIIPDGAQADAGDTSKKDNPYVWE